MVARIILVFLLAGLTGCGGGEEQSGELGKTTVVAAFYPLAFAAQSIGGPAADVTNLTPVGAEPHDLELSAREVERVRRADVVLFLGRGFQPALEDAVGDADGRALDLLEAVAVRPAESGDALDPHVWLDPARYRAIGQRVGIVLDRQAAAAGFDARLRRLDSDYRRGLAHCGRREIVTSHAAFGYLTERYGLDQIALAGPAPEAEPSARAIEDLVARVRASGATTIFFEPLVSPRLAQTVARESGARAGVLNPIEGLTEEEVEAGEDYFSLMRKNLRTLREALACH